MQTTRRFGAFSSSTDPQKLADTVKAVILGASALIILAASRIFHISFTPQDVNDLAVMLSGSIASIGIAYGLMKKLVVWAIDKWNSRNAAV